MSIEQSLATVAETNMQLMTAIRDLIETLSNRPAAAAEPARRTRKAKAEPVDVMEIVSQSEVEAQTTAFADLGDDEAAESLAAEAAEKVAKMDAEAAAAKAKAAAEEQAAAEQAKAAAVKAEASAKAAAAAKAEASAKAAAPAPAPAQPQALDYEKDVRPLLLAAAARAGMPAVLELLAAFGVKNGKELKPAQLQDVAVKAEALGVESAI